MPYLNSDGLFIKNGREEGVVAKGGTYSTLGPLQVTEVKLNLTVDATSTASQIVGASTNGMGVEIPDGVRIEAVEVLAETAATSGGAATLSVGLTRRDRTTVVNAGAFVNAAALATIDASGERSYLTTGSTGAGTVVGTTIANGGFITAQRGTADFTAGKVVVRIYWYKPQTLG